MKTGILFGCMLASGLAYGGWSRYITPPASYAAFQRRVERTATYSFDAFDVEVYRQANGPGTTQRVMMAVPKGAKGRLAAVAVPFYFPEAMLGFNPATGGLDSPLVRAGTNLTFYAGISYMADLAKRGYITASADAFHLTYPGGEGEEKGFSKWAGASSRLIQDWPGWTGIGKLVFDTRLLIDLIAADSRVDPDRIGIIGHSLGGKMAFYAGCLDKRIKVIVASDFGIGWDQTNWKDKWYWGGRLNIVRSEGFSHSDLLSLTDGKPFCLIAGKYDDAQSGIIMWNAKGYEAYPERLLFINHASGHRPPRHATESGYRFLDRYLKENGGWKTFK